MILSVSTITKEKPPSEVTWRFRYVRAGAHLPAHTKVSQRIRAVWMESFVCED